MKILIDSSTLYSAIAFPRKEQEMVKSLLQRYTVVTTEYIEKELRRNLKRSFSGKRKKEILSKLDIFISECDVKRVEDYKGFLEEAKKKISDKDAPILACAMLHEVDYLITSDKEFKEVKCEKAKILSSIEARKVLL